MSTHQRAICCTIWLAAACGASSAPDRPVVPAPDPLPPIGASAIEAHLRYLADDLLEGRAPGTRGGELAARYVAAQFRALGLESVAADGSYLQPVNLVGMTPQATMAWGPAGDARGVNFGEEFVAWGERPERRMVSDGDVVFVGYGIRAPEWQWDDYKDQDLRGKILLILVNDPGLQDSTVFNGRALTYYGRWTYKLEEAVRRGARGALLVHTTESATYPWSVVRASWTVEQFKHDRPESVALAFAGWVTADAATAALARGGHDLATLTAAAARRDFQPVATGLRAAVTITSAVRRVASHNVVARLPGADPAVAGEAVLFTAHHDHKGIGLPVDDDSIYNGAEDNASGVAAMLAAAQALTHAQPQPRRSVLFVATTAEESGLLGSEAYVQHPLVPLARTAAVVNLDVMNVRGATRDIGALGMDRSTLGKAFEAAAQAESLVVRRAPDLRGSFFRSDHFPFARAGVPAISLERGMDFVGRPPAWGRAQDSIWNTQRYHQPSDEYSTDFNYSGMVQQLRVAVRVALAVANGPDLPQWLTSSEFQRPRAVP